MAVNYGRHDIPCEPSPGAPLARRHLSVAAIAARDELAAIKAVEAA
jgi:hypothetical protein